MALSSIILRLARNPGAEHPDADPHDGYTITAPLTDDGHLDEAAVARSAAQCRVWRFQPDADDRVGRLVRRGSGWAIHYGADAEEAPDEAVYRLRHHRFVIGGKIMRLDGVQQKFSRLIDSSRPEQTVADGAPDEETRKRLIAVGVKGRSSEVPGVVEATHLAAKY